MRIVICAESHCILNRDPSPFKAEIANAKLRNYKSPGSDQILAELFHAGGETLQINKLVTFIWNKEELPDWWKGVLLYLFKRKAINLTVVITEEHHCYQLHTKFYLISSQDYVQ
jgi:hypothetical protein